VRGDIPEVLALSFSKAGGSSSIPPLLGRLFLKLLHNEWNFFPPPVTVIGKGNGPFFFFPSFFSLDGFPPRNPR